MKLKEFDYVLPKELIAQKPVFPKDSSNLMILKNDTIIHKKFYDIIDYLNKDDVLVINETKVKRCKIKGKKITGSPAEIHILKKVKDLYETRIKTKNPNIGTIIEFENGIRCKIVKTKGELFIIKFNKSPKELDMEFPFPTYIKRDSLSEEEYQPVFAKKSGSVAAPTASLHFTKDLMKKLKDKGIKFAKVCLHIDFGTFFELTVENIEDHKMHKEYYEIKKNDADIINNCKGKVIAVGTTVLRALESASENNIVYPKKEYTDIFIYPGYKFKSKTKALITNFHLPRSSLLLLVSAFIGIDKIKKAYRLAVKKEYRFFSLGDAMLLLR